MACILHSDTSRPITCTVREVGPARTLYRLALYSNLGKQLPNIRYSIFKLGAVLSGARSCGDENNRGGEHVIDHGTRVSESEGLAVLFLLFFSGLKICEISVTTPGIPRSSA